MYVTLSEEDFPKRIASQKFIPKRGRVHQFQNDCRGFNQYRYPSRMNIITAIILFTCYFFAVARAVVTCGLGAWADTSCVELKECPHYWQPLKWLYETDTIQYRSFLVNRIRPAMCDFKRESAMVCCPNKPPVKPINCGNIIWNKSLSPDGMPVELQEFPWLALLEYDTGCGKKFGCGGVLISDRHVLTAAHCLDAFGNKLVSVRLGEHDLRTARDCSDDPDSQYCSAEPIDVGIEKEMPHESYDFFRGPSDFAKDAFDIAVLKLNRSVVTDVIRPICLPDPIEKPDSLTDGKFLWAGWGFASNAVYPQSLVKLMSRIKRVSMAKCNDFYKSAMKKDTTCALSTSRKSACIADSGGPLMGFNNQLKMTVMGVYSPVNNLHCQKHGVPSTFVDVKKYVDWIQEKMQL